MNKLAALAACVLAFGAIPPVQAEGDPKAGAKN